MYKTSTLVFLIVLLTATGVKATPTVGLLTELSGSFAANGVDCRKGYEVAVLQSESEGKKPRVYFGDSRGEARSALSEMQRLVELEEAVAVVVNRSQVGMALAPLSQRSGVPLIGVIGHTDFVNNYSTVYRAWPNAGAEGATLAQTVWDLGHRTVSMATLDDEYLVSLTASFRHAFEQHGGRVIRAVEVIPAESDLRTLALLLMQGKPDALLINLGIPQLGPMYRILGELNNSSPTFSNYWLQTSEVLESAGESAEGAIFIEASLDVPEFFKFLTELSGSTGNLMMTYTCYVAARLALVAASASAIKTSKRLAEMSVLTTFDSELPIVDREVQFDLVAKQLVGSSLRTLDISPQN